MHYDTIHELLTDLALTERERPLTEREQALKERLERMLNK